MNYRGKKSNNFDFSVTSKQDGSRSFKGDHDDRFYTPPNSRQGRGRGSSRSRGRRGFKNFNANSSRFRNRHDGDGDDDESMGENRRGRGSFRNRRSRSMRRGVRISGGGQNRQFNPEKQWYKVMVPFGSRLGQDTLFRLIRENSDVEAPFENYHTIEQRAFFFVQGLGVAESLKFLSNRISTPNGRKLIITANESQPPKNVTVSPEHVDILKVRMSDRYDPSTHLLNLGSFQNDEKLQQDDLTHLQINKYSVMEAITKIIAEYIPEITGLNLSNNRIGSLGLLSRLTTAAPGVTVLNLGENTIRSLDEVEKLKGWTNIVDLNLDGNSLCNAYSNDTEYISAVRKIFPKVIRLDGKELPPPISFDLDVVSLPPTKDSYFMNDEIKTLLVSFVKEYYSIFDSDNRRSLMAAYNENAQFSYYVSRNTTMDNHRQGDFQAYFSDSRNLKKIANMDSEKKNKKVKVGVLSVVSALEEFPKTTHDLNSFKVDVMLANPQILSFVLHGLYKETNSKADKPTIRMFSRTFITVPAGAGVSIINDMLTVSNAGIERAMTAFKEGAPTPSSSPASSSQTTSTAQPEPSPAEQQKLVEEFSKQSRMNAQYSLICLRDNSWDFNLAAQNFQELNSQGKLPPEAFSL